MKKIKKIRKDNIEITEISKISILFDWLKVLWIFLKNQIYFRVTRLNNIQFLH